MPFSAIRPSRANKGYWPLIDHAICCRLVSALPPKLTVSSTEISCGNCFECDTCYGVCPDNAVIKLGAGKRFEFKYDYRKGWVSALRNVRAVR